MAHNAKVGSFMLSLIRPPWRPLGQVLMVLRWYWYILVRYMVISDQHPSIPLSHTPTMLRQCTYLLSHEGRTQ